MAGRDLRGRRWLPPLGVAGLVLLTILDVVLVVLAFRHVDPPSSPSAGAAGASAVRSQAAEDESTSPDRDTPSGSSAPAAGEALPEGPLLVALAPDGTVLRAAGGSCEEGTGPQIAVAGPGATSFRDVTMAADLRGVWAMRADGRGELSVVGPDSDCVAVSYARSGGRRAWAEGSAADTWYVDPTQGGTVHAPGGPVEVPCTPAVLSTVGAVRLLCDGGSVLGTSDGGATWVALGRLDDADALAFDGPGRGIALAARDDCAVSVLVTTNGGAGWEPSGCLDGSTGRAIAMRGDAVVAVVDGTVWRSADGGETWERQGA